MRDDIRILESKSTANGFEFDGIATGGKVHHFSMTSETLRELAGINASQLDLAKVFERHRQKIYSVAARVFGAGVRGEPIEMKIGFFQSTSI